MRRDDTFKKDNYIVCSGKMQCCVFTSWKFWKTPEQMIFRFAKDSKHHLAYFLWFLSTKPIRALVKFTFPSSSISRKSRFTWTVVRSLVITAQSISTAAMYSLGTLINIWKLFSLIQWPTITCYWRRNSTNWVQRGSHKNDRGPCSQHNGSRRGYKFIIWYPNPACLFWICRLTWPKLHGL